MNYLNFERDAGKAKNTIHRWVHTDGLDPRGEVYTKVFEILQFTNLSRFVKQIVDTTTGETPDENL